MTQMMDFLSIFTDGIVAGSRILKIMDTEELTPQQSVGANGEIIRGKLNFAMLLFLMTAKTKY